MKEMFRYGFILGFICFLAGLVLSGVNALTEPVIAQQKELGHVQAFKELVPAAETFKPFEKDGSVLFFEALDGNKNIIGFLVKASQKGYSSTIETLTALKPDLEIIAIKVLSQDETPGLGTRVTENSFTDQFKGKTLSTYSSVQAITGATISSSAVIHSVKARLEELKDIMMQEAARGR
ncbi:MAG TPA: FMN-binding protein [Candidatus Omnitrophota bacterium]|nr:FMN-binding protein [Candidatus Omnitrophota bacterium]HPT07439.1 FMN-binding protein [Candidatus Omnitrophota bacterium]